MKKKILTGGIFNSVLGENNYERKSKRDWWSGFSD